MFMCLFATYVNKEYAYKVTSTPNIQCQKYLMIWYFYGYYMHMYVIMLLHAWPSFNIFVIHNFVL